MLMYRILSINVDNKKGRKEMQDFEGIAIRSKDYPEWVSLEDVCKSITTGKNVANIEAFSFWFCRNYNLDDFAEGEEILLEEEPSPERTWMLYKMVIERF